MNLKSRMLRLRSPAAQLWLWSSRKAVVGIVCAEPADPADETVGREEGQIIEADDRGADRFRRDLGEERQPYRQEMREGDVVEKVKRDRPEEPDFLSWDPGVAAAVTRQSVPPIEKTEPMMILVSSSGSR